MFMQYLNINKSYSCLVFLALLCFCGVALGMSGQEAGTVVGSMAFVNDREPNTLGDAANVTVELEHKGRIALLVSNDHGDYVKEFPTGTYCLKSAHDSAGNELRFSPDQYKCFKIRSKKDTRFDVMLLK
jgi:hypothetical protein